MSGDAGNKKGRIETKGTTFHSLAELGGVDLGQRLELPVIDLTSLDPEKLEANAALIEQKQGQIRQWVPIHLAAIATVEVLSPKAQRLAQTKVTEIKEGLKEILDHENGYYRAAGWLALLLFNFSKDLQSLEEVGALLLALVKKGHLKEADKSTGFIRFQDRLYRVPDGVEFEPEERKEVEEAFFALFYRARKAEELNDISWTDLMAGKPGSITLGIPPEEVLEEGEKTGRWRPGGQLRVRSDGTKIFPVRITTGNQNLRDAVTRAVELGVSLNLEHFNSDTPPTGLRLDAEGAGKVKLFWFLMKRAKQTELDRQERQRIRDEMAANLATVTTEQFFLDGQPGICQVSLVAWQTKDLQGNETGTLYDPYLFPERTVEEGAEGEDPISYISILPERVSEQFREYLDTFAVNKGEEEEKEGEEKKEPFWGKHPEGNDFDGLPYPLNSLMRRARTLTDRTSKISNGSNGDK